MNLADLLARDLSEIEDETLVAGLRDAEKLADDATGWSGLIVSELKRRHSWSRLVDLTGIKQTTLHNRMYPRRGRDEELSMPEPASVPAIASNRGQKVRITDLLRKSRPLRTGQQAGRWTAIKDRIRPAGVAQSELALRGFLRSGARPRQGRS